MNLPLAFTRSGPGRTGSAARSLRARIAARLLLAGTLVLIAGGLALAQPDAEAETSERVEPLRLLHSDARRIELELRTEAAELESITTRDGRAVRPRVAGLDHSALPGQPDLPTRVVLLGIPPAGTPRLEIEVRDRRRLALTSPVAAVEDPNVAFEEGSGLVDPSTERFAAQPLIGETQEPAAAAPVARMEIGWLRDQRIARIEIRPMSLDADASELIQHLRVRVRLHFDDSAGPGAATSAGIPPGTSGAQAIEPGPSAGGVSDFDLLLDRALLNADSARAWRQSSGTTPDGLAVPAPPAGQLLANIHVESDGLYSLRGFDLVLAGVSLQTVDARKLQLFEQGEQLAIEVDGQSDGRLDLSDRIRFYGRASESRESKQRVYQLVHGGSTGLRVGSRAVAPGGARSPLTSYTATHRVDFDARYLSDLPRVQRAAEPPPGPPQDRWYSVRISDAQPMSLNLSGLQVAPGAGDARLHVSAVGRSSILAVSPDHELRVRAGGSSIGQVSWDGDLRIERFVLTLPAGRLQQDPLELRFEATGQTGALFDHFHLDEMSLDYRRRLRAEAGWLRFRPDPGRTAFDLDGFASDDLRLYDLGQPSRPVLLEGWDLAGVPTDRILRFDDGVSGANYLALESSQIRSPAAIIARQGIAPLTPPAGGADYLILAHPSFVSALQPLLAARRANMRAELVDLQRVYDAFGGGQPSARAIRDMIAWAYHQWPGPRLHYVLLVGDGNYDMLGRTQGGNPNFLPPHLSLADPWLGEVSSDNAYAAVNGEDYFPDLLLGRLPVSSVGDASRVVQRILDYERASPTGSWRSQLLFAADDPDVADFRALSDAIIQGHVPPAFTSQRVYLGQTHGSITQARAAIIAAINQGRLVTQYVGHGQSRAWAAENLLRESDFAGLTNGDRLTVMFDWTCLTGRFDEPLGRSMAESALLAPSGGAVAYVAPTGFGVATGHDLINRAVFDALMRDGTTQVGALLLAGKLRLFGQTGAYHDLLETYTLFGDPATPIQLPPGFQPVGPPSTATVLPQPSATPTVPPSPTPSPSATRTATASPTATRTPTATRSATPSPSATASPTRTSTASPSPTPSRTPTATQSATSTRTPTATPTATRTATQTATASSTTPMATATRTVDPTATSTGTSTSSPTGTSTASSVPNATDTPSVTAAPSATATQTAMGSPIPTATGTGLPTPGASASPTPTAGASPTLEPSPTVMPSSSPTASEDPEPTPLPTGLPTAGPSATVGTDPTAFPTATGSVVATPRDDPTPTEDPNGTRTPNATAAVITPTPESSATADPDATPPVEPSSTTQPEPSATPPPPSSPVAPAPSSTRTEGESHERFRLLLPLLVQRSPIGGLELD